MEELKLQVLREFEVTAKRIIKEKSYYICNTDKGVKIVKKTFDTRESIIFQNKIKNHLYENGFRNIDMFKLSKAEIPYVEMGGEIYVMTEFVEGRESNFWEKEEFLRVVKEVAKMHKVGQGIKFDNEIFYREENLIKKSEKNLSEMKAIRKRISSQKKILDFDVLFLNNYNYYEEQLKETIEILKSNRYIEEKECAENRIQICHNLLKEENIQQTKEGIRIGSFSKVNIGSKIQDIAMLVQRHRKSTREAIDIEEIIEVYNSENESMEEERKILYGILKYPEKYMKVVNQYYSKKRSWVPGAINNRMETIIESQREYKKYIENFCANYNNLN